MSNSFFRMLAVLGCILVVLMILSYLLDIVPIWLLAVLGLAAFVWYYDSRDEPET